MFSLRWSYLVMELPDHLVVLTPLTYRECRPAAHESSVGEICCLLTPSCDLEAGVGGAHQILSILLICINTQRNSVSTASYSLCYLG